MDDIMATKKKAGDDVGLDRQIGVRLAPADYDRLEKLAVHLSVSAIARAALLIGLDVVERQPGVLVGETPKKR